MRMELVIGNKNYSSWSLRPWLLMKTAGISFDEILVQLDTPTMTRDIKVYNPSGTVPALIIHHDSGEKEIIGDSLAIAETLAERFPDAGIWPQDPALRAQARSISAEMHSSFMALRSQMPMNIRRKKWKRGPLEPTPDTAKNIARIEEIWTGCRNDPKRPAGDFLYGPFSAADAMYAPVASRLYTYEVPLSTTAQAYIEALYALPAMQQWIVAAEAEEWTLEREEA